MTNELKDPQPRDAGSSLMHFLSCDSQLRGKVCDFGLTKIKERTWLSTKNTQAGTPAFMASQGARLLLVL